MKKNISILLSSVLVVLSMLGCQKKERPSLGDYPKDDSRPPLPGGSLRFYIPFGENDQVRYEAKDSISGDPAWVYPFSLVDGVSGKGVQGADGKAIKYMNSNDINLATSFAISFWLKSNAAAGRTEFVFSLVDDTYSWHHSAVFLLVENQTSAQTTMKLGLMDQWLEGTFAEPLFDGQWHHMVYSYDEITSKMTYYFDGNVVNGLTATQTDVKKNGNPRGPVDFSMVTNIAIGGWNKHINVAGATDDWIKSYAGKLDQFRIYNKPLTPTEVLALYTAKQ